MQYQWAVKVTIFLTAADGTTTVKIEHRDADTQQQAIARYKGLMSYLLNPDRAVSRYRRITSAEVTRRPVGDWEYVDASEMSK